LQVFQFFIIVTAVLVFKNRLGHIKKTYLYDVIFMILEILSMNYFTMGVQHYFSEGKQLISDVMCAAFQHIAAFQGVDLLGLGCIYIYIYIATAEK